VNIKCDDNSLDMLLVTLSSLFILFRSCIVQVMKRLIVIVLLLQDGMFMMPCRSRKDD
jgi:hypothetical protein